MTRFVTNCNAHELRARRRQLCCDLCGAPIEPGERYYLLEGLRVCAESDCLVDWAAPYAQRAEEDEEDEI